MIANYFIAAAVILFIITVVLGILWEWVAIVTGIASAGCGLTAYYLMNAANQTLPLLQPRQLPPRQLQPSQLQPRQLPPILSPTPQKESTDTQMTEFEVPYKTPPAPLNADSTPEAIEEYKNQVNLFLKGYEKEIIWENEHQTHYDNDILNNVKISDDVKNKKILHNMQNAWRNEVRTFLSKNPQYRGNKFNTHNIN